MSAITSPTPRKNRRKPCETVGGFEGSVLWLGQLYTINTPLHLLQSLCGRLPTRDVSTITENIVVKIYLNTSTSFVIV